MGRHVAANGLTLLIALLVAAVIAAGWGQHEFTRPGPLTEPVCLRVERGANITAVSRSLEAEGAVRSPAIFRMGSAYLDRTGDLRFGSYLIEPGASMAEILDIVTRGGASTCGTEINLIAGIGSASLRLRAFDATTGRLTETARFDPRPEAIPDPAALENYARLAAQPDTRFRITVVEGTTVWQVAQTLAAAPFLEGEIPELPPEGMLAPDSYEVRAGADRAALLAEMTARQARILDELWQTRSPDAPARTPEEALILASIIEKETGQADERAMIASVFVNRLARGMRLQMDATVEYGVTRGQAPLGRGLRQSELRAPTPWNTYVIDGLPQTPIANPGRAAIAAALNPGQSDYVYFVADGTGGHAFAATLAEHNRNVARWRAIEAERRAD